MYAIEVTFFVNTNLAWLPLLINCWASSFSSTLLAGSGEPPAPPLPELEDEPEEEDEEVMEVYHCKYTLRFSFIHFIKLRKTGFLHL